MIEIRQVSFEELFEFPSISSGVTAQYIHQNKGDIPVYGSRKDGKPVGYIKDNLPGIKYFSNCLSWNRNGSVGYVFYRDHRFTTTDDHRPLVIKKPYLDILDVDFLKYMVQREIFSNGFAWENKAGPEKIKRLFLSIPVKDGIYDIKVQKKIANKYLRIEHLRNRINNYYNILKNCTIQINLMGSQTTKEDLSILFEAPYKGHAKYTSKYILDNKGEFPVFSASTRNDGKIGQISTYDWDTENETWLTWTTDGIYAGTVFERQGRFSMNTHCGLLKPKKSLQNIDVSYIRHVLNRILPNYAVGDQNKRVTKEIIQTVLIPIPIDSQGRYDLDKQKEIARKYDTLESNRKALLDLLNQILKAQIKIDFF